MPVKKEPRGLEKTDFNERIAETKTVNLKRRDVIFVFSYLITPYCEKCQCALSTSDKV